MLLLMKQTLLPLNKDKVTVDSADYYVATLEKPMSDYTFTFNSTAVTPTAVNRKDYC